MKTLELHYPMIQFLIIKDILEFFFVFLFFCFSGVFFCLLGLPTPFKECLFRPATVANFNSLMFSWPVVLANKRMALAFKRKINSISRTSGGTKTPASRV